MIDNIYMLVDRDIEDRRFQKIFRAARAGEQEGYYRITRAESGQVIWADRSSQITIKIIHPTFSHNIEAKNPNQASAVIVLEVNNERLFAWPGDMEMRSIKVIRLKNMHFMTILRAK